MTSEMGSRYGSYHPHPIGVSGDVERPAIRDDMREWKRNLSAEYRPISTADQSYFGNQDYSVNPPDSSSHESTIENIQLWHTHASLLSLSGTVSSASRNANEY